MIRAAKRLARSGLERLNDYNPVYRDAHVVERRERSALPHPVLPGRRHLDAAIQWVKRAQDATSSGGVSWGYRARRAVRSAAPLGWQAPYPETTGYLIPTMLRYAEKVSDPDSHQRAQQMARWELGIQLPDGGFQGGTLGAQPVASSTFVTGQVLFGLVAICRSGADDRYLEAADRAGRFLLDCLDDSGRFLRGYSFFCAPGAKAYEVRTGLALAELAELTSNSYYRNAASRVADYALSCQAANGWFRENDLENHAMPLTHTIGYVLEGLYGLGRILNRSDCLSAINLTLRHIDTLVDEKGFLAGRWFHDWTPAVDWACLTGSVQIAGVCLQLQRSSQNGQYVGLARRLLGFVAYTQELGGSSPGLSGAIRGSYPFGGGYCQWSCPNWAAKFFADAVMDFLPLVDGDRSQT